MQIPPLQRQVKAADLDIEKLAGNSRVSQAEKVAEASRQFEAILVRQILTSANVLAPGGTAKSATNGIYQDLLTHHLANTICHSQGTGLSKSLARELGKQLRLKDESTAKEIPV